MKENALDNSSPLYLTALGSKELAYEVLQKMYVDSKAYRELLREKLNIQKLEELKHIEWSQLPLLTKKNFYALYPWKDLLSKETYDDIYAIDRSSGTTSKSGGFFWPELKSQYLHGIEEFKKLAIDTFKLNQRRTLVIVGFSLGSWSGGMTYSFFFKLLALQVNFPLVVFTPGNEHEEIIEIIEKMKAEFDQILILLCPSAIFYLEHLAEQKNVQLPLEKISFLLGGEPFSEEMRIDLIDKIGSGHNGMPINSYYGAADAGLLGIESIPLIKVRQILYQNPDIALACGFTPHNIPNLYHLLDDEVYLEIIENQLVITKWQGLPLVRYNIEDNVKFISWKMLCLSIAHQRPEEGVWKEFANYPLTDLIAISGRSDNCVFLCGTNIYDNMLQAALSKSSLKDITTGIFVAWSSIEEGRQVLNWQIELKKGQNVPNESSRKKIHEELVHLMGEQQPEFALDYQKFYQALEKENLMLFNLTFCEAPYLLNHPKLTAHIKRKIFVDKGPL